MDAAISAAFLDALAPLSLAVSARVLDRIEQDLAAQRHQRDLQLEQARYEVRLAQRQYDLVDPDNRLVAAELERRWNAKLTRLVHLERAYAQAAQAAQWTLSAQERVAIDTLAQDLPALWQAPSTSIRDRKQLLRYAVEAVSLDARTVPGQIIVQIHWRSGTITQLCVARPVPGDGSLQTPAEAVALIRALAPSHTYAQIAAALNAAGWHSAFGRAFTSLHVGYVCRREGLGRGVRRSERSTDMRCRTALYDVTALSAENSVTPEAGGAHSFPAPFAQ